ncbi:hypothetical protein [Streptomyces sp. NPDC002172]
MLHDAGSTLSVLGGLALVAGGLGEEAGGVLLDATGIGAALGIPINVAAAAQIAVGVSMAGAGLANIVNDATGPDRVDMTSDGTGGAEAVTGIRRRRRAGPGRRGSRTLPRSRAGSRNP